MGCEQLGADLEDAGAQKGSGHVEEKPQHQLERICSMSLSFQADILQNLSCGMKRLNHFSRLFFECYGGTELKHRVMLSGDYFYKRKAAFSYSYCTVRYISLSRGR